MAGPLVPTVVDYLRHADALRFIEDCEQRGIRILGMEFFVVAEGSVRPVGMESRELLKDASLTAGTPSSSRLSPSQGSRRTRLHSALTGCATSAGQGRALELASEIERSSDSECSRYARLRGECADHHIHLIRLAAKR